MPSWEVIVTRISTQTVTVEGDTQAEALKKVRAMAVEHRGPETVDWNYDACEIETSDSDD